MATRKVTRQRVRARARVGDIRAFAAKFCEVLDANEAWQGAPWMIRSVAKGEGRGEPFTDALRLAIKAGLEVTWRRT